MNIREYSLKAKRFAFQANNMSSSLITRKMVQIKKKGYKVHPDYIKDYKNFSQHLIKKGKKTTIENVFKKGVIHLMKNADSIKFDKTLKKAFNCIKPGVGLKTKRRGSKNIYIPYRLTERRSKYISAN